MAGVLNQWSSTGVWRLASAESLQHGDQSLGWALLLVRLSLGKRRSSNHLSKTIIWNLLVQPWGHSTAAMNLCQVGTLLIASARNMYFFTFSYHQFENCFYIWQEVYWLSSGCFPIQFFISFHVSQCFTRSYPSLCSFCDRAHPQTWNCTFWTRDVCSKAYSLWFVFLFFFFKDLNNLQNLDPAASSNECSQDWIRELKHSVVAILLPHYVFVSS